ncbi:LysR substrate-binding domain-containing protein [Litoribrevibacter albus]|uniref:Transcriptional regulator GcvA n=1 Tax=Litoribrevibacter albus TaxID=1473156 RepID=A0AA37SEY7_9GAMM|nr:LysR substrate-binding domain-containing protein [Litoribrevibacter albus]GLQ33197.1 transcriptional regulator GcvA [Litoribrevibacter albus]
MSTPLPPLQSLKAFLLAAEHESFKLAATELHLTPSAISHQIKGLEDTLGLELFRRQNRQIKLTPAGQMYKNIVEKALNELSSGTDRLKRQFSQNVLRARIPPMIASDFIIPNLSEFQQHNPNIELRLETSLKWANPERDDLDVILYFGTEPSHTDVSYEKVTSLSATPVMSPALQDSENLQLQTLTQHRLIHSSVVSDGWKRFFSAFDEDYQPQNTDLWLDSYTSILQSCTEGHGITLGLLPLLKLRLDRGELIRPIEEVLELPEALYLVYRKDKRLTPAIKTFSTWIKGMLQNLTHESV